MHKSHKSHAMSPPLHLQERLSYFTAFALLMAVISILLVFLPHMLGNKGTNVHGDVLGVAAGASLGALLTINRSAALRCPNAGMMLASSFGSWLSVLLGYLMLLSSGNGDAILPGTDTRPPTARLHPPYSPHTQPTPPLPHPYPR